MKIYDRRKKEYIETQQYGQGKLEFLYGNAFGRILLKLVISPFTSKIYGLYNSSPASKKKVKPFIEKYNISIDEFEKSEYNSFNEFFTRKRKPDFINIDKNADSLISPADSKLLVYNITNDLRALIKGSTYTINELVSDKADVSEFNGGLCLVFRLCMDDYHRYCFIDSGKLLNNIYIKGKLHTVSSISKDYKVYKENSRIVNILDTEHFGEVIQIEVGALLVGKIVDHHVTSFKKGDEKGYFEPGGSTIVLLLKKNTAEIDSDILQQSQNGIETIVKYGERIGKKSNA